MRDDLTQLDHLSTFKIDPIIHKYGFDFTLKLPSFSIASRVFSFVRVTLSHPFFRFLRILLLLETVILNDVLYSNTEKVVSVDAQPQALVRVKAYPLRIHSDDFSA
jgi:hypothetical protein